MQVDIILKGSHYDIGFQLGKWWGDYITILKKINQCPEVVSECYDYLNNGWNLGPHKKNYSSWLKNIRNHKFADIWEEIVGITDGVNYSEWRRGDRSNKTSYKNVFSICLGETSEKMRCSSLVKYIGNSWFLGHNEENDYLYPLCISKVYISGKEPFVSISYPFQLLGSSMGWNNHIAFQGNSISFGKDSKPSSWKDRIPKTVFSRRMLDKKDIKEVKDLYQAYGSTLPNHHYIISREGAFSLEIRLEGTRNQLRMEPIDRKKGDIHTNHFMKENGDIDRDWICDEWKRGSQKRYKHMKTLLRKKEISEVMDGFQTEKKSTWPRDYWKTTSISCFLQFNKRKFSAEIHKYYFSRDNILKLETI